MMNKVSLILFILALFLLVGLQAWIFAIDHEQLFKGKYTVLSPVMYMTYSIPSVLFFVVSQAIFPQRKRFLSYVAVFFLMIALYIFLTPETGLTFEQEEEKVLRDES